jgi:hypothetical protein
MPVVVRNETGERDGLLAYLDAHRGAVRRAVLGVSDEDAARRTTVSELTLGGLLKHVTWAERNWVRSILLGEPRPAMEFADTFVFDPARGETLAGLLADHKAEAAHTEEVIRGLPDLEVSVPLPEAPWFPPGMKVSARWILLHLTTEVARHAGHADIIREALDGKTAFELTAAATTLESAAPMPAGATAARRPAGK